MPANTSPDNIEYPVPGDQIAPLNTKFQTLAETTQDALTANAGNGFRFRQTVRFTSSGTFAKADYPWLRAVRVKCVAPGAPGSGGDTADRGTAGGGAGETAESWILVADLAASEAVVVGAGPTCATGDTAPDDAPDTTFGSTKVVARGGDASPSSGLLSPAGGTGGTGDFLVAGGGGGAGGASGTPGGTGGASSMGGGGGGGFASGVTSTNGSPGLAPGSGGGGAFRSGSDVAGGKGADGVVIVELFA